MFSSWITFSGRDFDLFYKVTCPEVHCNEKWSHSWVYCNVANNHMHQSHQLPKDFFPHATDSPAFADHRFPYHSILNAQCKKHKVQRRFWADFSNGFMQLPYLALQNAHIHICWVCNLPGIPIRNSFEYNIDRIEACVPNRKSIVASVGHSHAVLVKLQLGLVWFQKLHSSEAIHNTYCAQLLVARSADASWSKNHQIPRCTNSQSKCSETSF